MRLPLAKLLQVSVLFCLLVSVASCDKMQDNVYNICQGGTVCILDVAYDGSSMSLGSGENVSKEAVFYEQMISFDNSDQDGGSWFVELDWIRVHYKPASRQTFVFIKENQTGSRRQAKLTAVKDGKRTVIAEFRQR